MIGDLIRILSGKAFKKGDKKDIFGDIRKYDNRDKSIRYALITVSQCQESFGDSLFLHFIYEHFSWQLHSTTQLPNHLKQAI